MRNPMKSILLLLALSIILLFSAFVCGDRAAEGKAYVLDEKGKAVKVVSLADGKILTSWNFDKTPLQVTVSPDGGRVIVFESFKTTGKVPFGWRDPASILFWAAEKGYLSFFDAKSLQRLSRIEAGWGTVHYYNTWGGVLRATYMAFNQSGDTMYLLCVGFKNDKPDKTLPCELLKIDLTKGLITGRLPIERRGELILLPTERTAVILLEPHKKYGWESKLIAVDLDRMALIKEIPLRGKPLDAISTAGDQHLYVPCRGNFEKDAAQNEPASMCVLDTTNWTVKREVKSGYGFSALRLDRTGKRLFVACAGDIAKRENDEKWPGSVLLFQGGELAATFDLPSMPSYMFPTVEGRRLYVVCQTSVHAFDLQEMQQMGSASFKPGGMGLWSTSYSTKKPVRSFIATSDGRKGFLTFEDSSKMVVLDLENGKTEAEVTVGRSGVRIWKYIGAAAAAGAVGGITGYTPIVSVSGGDASLLLDPDEKFLYVLNAASNDVTVMKTDTREVAATITVGGGAESMRLLPGGAGVLAVTCKTDNLRLIDVKTNAKVAEQDKGGNYQHTWDNRFAVAPDKQRLLIMDGATLKTLSTVEGFSEIGQVVLEPPPPGKTTPDSGQ